MSTLTTDRGRPRKADPIPAMVPGSWDDFCRLYPIYEALIRQLELADGPYPSGVKFGSWSDKSVRERDLRWLEEMDEQVQAVDLRHFLVAPEVAREDSLRLFVRRHLAKPEKLPADRDKIDLLLVQYFVLCAPPELIAGSVENSDVAGLLKPVLGDVDPGLLQPCEPLDGILEAARECSSLRDLMDQGLLEQGKSVKAEVGDSFYESAALIAICRFNFLLRRSFIQMLHADLRAIGAALAQLEKRGVKAVDCSRSGLSAKEPLAKLQHFHEHWKPPFRNDYSQNSAFQAYEQLMSLREDLEAALGPASKPAKPSLAAKPSAPAVPAGAKKPQNAVPTPPAKPAAPVASGKPAAPAPPAAKPAAPAPVPEAPLPEIAVADIESLEEKIWEQLIATPPVRGRSMTTVALDNARILLSAWEVAAFISDSGQDSEDLRRLIVARALISTAIERRKRTMDLKVLPQAVAHARVEIPRFQERVDQLKKTMKTDGAVNLGISLKRLLSLVDEAEQLQKGNEAKPEKR